jgi:type 1 glutamine amidotransferase
MSPKHRKMRKLRIFLFLGLSLIFGVFAEAGEKKPHAVFLLGTLHYSPELTMPVFARELERFGFRTTLVRGEGNPEKKTENVLPNIGVLKDADVVIFFSRFMKLPDSEWQAIEDYLKSGKPVIGLRTANHSFKYAKDHPRFEWNDGFGRRALGTPYIVHQSSETEIAVVAENVGHPIMTHVTKRKWVSPGTLYLARLEKGCLPLVTGSGKGRSRLLKKSFGEIQVKEFETAPVAWAWKNEWGGKSFYTSFGHPGDFAEESFNRMLLNSICWAVDQPLPPKDAKISTWQIERVDKKKKK